MKKNLFFFLFFFLGFQGLLAATEAPVSSSVEEALVAPVAETPVLSNDEAAADVQAMTEEDDDDYITLTEVIVNAFASIKHAIEEGVDAVVSPISAGKKYVVAGLKNEFGQEKYHAHLAPAAVVLGAKNIEMLFAFLTHVILKSEKPGVKQLRLGGFSVPLQEVYERVYQSATSDVLDYKQKTIAEKIAKIVPEVGVIALWHTLAKGFLVDQTFEIAGNKFKVEDNTDLLLQGQLANTLDGSIDEFLSLEPEQMVFGAIKAFLRGATVFARTDVHDASYELTNENLKQAGIEAALPLVIDGCVNKLPLGLTKVNKKKLEHIITWISKTMVRQILFPQK